MDEDILKTVESMLGKNVKIVDCEKTSSIREEEILLINGIPVQLEGDDGNAIKTALIAGQVPSCELLNQLLYQAGILRQPVQLETTISVKSSLVTKEDVTVARDGKILDERSNETSEHQYYSSLCDEVWEPVPEAIKTITNQTDSLQLHNDEILTIDSPNHQYINKIPFRNKKRETIDSLITSNAVTEKIRIPVSSNVLTAISNNGAIGNNIIKSSIASLTSKPKIELSSSSLLSTGSSSADSGRTESIIHDHDHHFNGNKNSNIKCQGATSNAVNSSNFLFDDPFLTTTTLNTTAVSNDESVRKRSTAQVINDINTMDENDVIIDRISGIYNSKKQIIRNNSNSENFILSNQNSKTKVNSNLSSCDSGHDDLFNSISQTYLLQNSNTDKSLPSYCEYNNSSDEMDFQKLNQKHKGQRNKPRSPAKPNRNKISSSLKETDDESNHEPINSLDTKSKLDTTTDANFLVYREGNLISGPFDNLIKHIVPTCDYYPDHSYVFAFLLSARLFIRPHELLERICQLCEEQQNITIKTQDHGPSTSFQSSSSIIPGSTNLTTSETIKKLRMFAKNFLKLLSEWINIFPYDFRDERLMQHVRSMQQKCINIDSNLRKDVSEILQNLLDKLTVLEKYECFLQSISADCVDFSNCKNNSSNNSCNIGNKTNFHLNNSLSSSNNCAVEKDKPILSSSSNYVYSLMPSYTNHSMSSSSIGSVGSASGNSVEIFEVCPTPTVLSQQLTHIELERLSHIGPEEFVQVFAKENASAGENQKKKKTNDSLLLSRTISDAKKTRNLETYVHWFNRLSYLVASEIVKYQKKKQRVRVVEYWIETARECFNIGNFNSLMAIIAGLNMSSISRLKKTWAKVQSAKFSVLEHQMDPSNNFNSYRSTLKAAMWRSAGATNERERIIIPFFSLLVKDLYFLNEGCSNRLENGHINFEKFWQVSKQIKEFISWKEVICPFERDEKVIMYLQTNHILNENTLALASFECEPPENQLEKDRLKSLKSEI